MPTHAATDLRAIRSEIAARLGLPDLADEEAFEQECRSYLCGLRWPGGVECPRCSESTRLLWLASRSKWHCYACRYQFSVTAGTVFHSSHLAVWKWFVAIHLMLTGDGVSAYELRRALGGSYKTAWFAAHRIRAAMRGHGTELLRSLLDAELRSGGDGRTAAAGLDQVDRRVLARMRRIAGPRQPLSAKYLTAYIDERGWRSRHEGNPFAFRDTIHALLHAEGISYDRLVAASV